MMKRIILLVLMYLVLSPVGFSQALTTITDRLSQPNGAPVTGTLTISAAVTFITADGQTTVTVGSQTVVVLDSTGMFSISLAPNVGGAPNGSFYYVDYKSPTKIFRENWNVPVSSIPVRLRDVRVIWPQGLPNVLIPASQFAPPPSCGSAQVLRRVTNGWICGADNLGAFSIDIQNPTAADSGVFQWKAKNGFMLTRISCDVDGGTVSVNLEIRTEAAPNAPGTLVLSVPLVCTPVTASTTSFVVPHVPSSSPVALAISTTTGSPGVVRVHPEYQLD